MVAFEYEGVTITLKQANGLNRMWLNRLRNTYPGYFELPSDEQYYVDEVLNLLYLVDSVEGDLGFPVPTNGNTTAETLKVFVDNMFRSDEQLYVNWKIALYNTRQAIKSDPDLLPPQELTDDQKKIQASETSEKSNDLK